MGGSYGGALSLMLGGIDRRVDAVVPLITWNSLSDALFPNFVDGAADGDPLNGVFKKYWASVLVTSISLSGGGAGGLGASARRCQRRRPHPRRPRTRSRQRPRAPLDRG